MKSTRLINITNKRQGLWVDSETDLSSSSDNDSPNSSTKSITEKTSTKSLKKNCCLICSISSSLSNANCCPKHLTLLTKKLPTQINGMMSSRGDTWPRFEGPCQSPYHRLRSLSLSPAHFRHRRKKSPGILRSFNTNGLLLSPNRGRSISSYIESRWRSTSSQQHRSNHLSPSLINSTMNNNNYSRKRNRISSSPIVVKRKQRNIVQTEPVVEKESTEQTNQQSPSADLLELDSRLLHPPRILLKRVIHVKDDEEEEDESLLTNHQITLNMAQATKQMSTQKSSQPKILLKRVCLEQ